MNYSDEDVELIVAWNEKRKAFVAAKDARPAHPDDDPKAEEAYQTAKAEMGAVRTEWRQIREYLAATADDDETMSGDGDAIVSPGTVGIPTGGQLDTPKTEDGE
jgi:hypothetical protein